MTELEEIFKTAEHFSDKWQPYFEIYTRHLSRYRDKEITLVEIGVQGGGSLDMWSKFLPKAKIIGIDNDPECMKLQYDNPNIQVCFGNQADPVFWKTFFENNPEVDVIVDDGGHEMHQQVISLENCFPNLKVGGVYIIEDCHTSYMPDYKAEIFHPGTFIEYSKVAIDILNANWRTKSNPEFERRLPLFNDLSGVFFYDSVVVFEKFGKREMTRVFSK
jgi:cephalosporin hydroxylase